MRSVYLLLIYLLIYSAGFSQQKTEYFPTELNIQPFTANILEPKLGFSFKLNESDIRLDIGNSRDLIQYAYNDSTRFSFGVDLFTFTKLNGETDFHFPVDAVDYLFGLNAGYRKTEKDFEYGFRFRISHISAHFVDGHFDPQLNTWKNNRNPIVYSREFIEFLPFWRKETIRVYGGFTYLFHVVPKDIGKMNLQTGFDLFVPQLFNKRINPFIAYDLKLIKLKKYSGVNSLTAGVKFGNFNSSGFSISLNYFAGFSLHGEYFDMYEKYLSLNFNIDL